MNEWVYVNTWMPKCFCEFLALLTPFAKKAAFGLFWKEPKHLRLYSVFCDWGTHIFLPKHAVRGRIVVCQLLTVVANA